MVQEVAGKNSSRSERHDDDGVQKVESGRELQRVIVAAIPADSKALSARSAAREGSTTAQEGLPDGASDAIHHKYRALSERESINGEGHERAEPAGHPVLEMREERGDALRCAQHRRNPSDLKRHNRYGRRKKDR